MQILFIIFLIIFSITCVLIRHWFFTVFYKPWLDSTFLERGNKDEENQPTHDSVEIEVKKRK